MSHFKLPLMCSNCPAGQVKWRHARPSCCLPYLDTMTHSFCLTIVLRVVSEAVPIRTNLLLPEWQQPEACALQTTPSVNLHNASDGQLQRRWFSWDAHSEALKGVKALMDENDHFSANAMRTDLTVLFRNILKGSATFLQVLKRHIDLHVECGVSYTTTVYLHCV